MNDILANGMAFVLVPKDDWARVVDTLDRIEKVISEKEKPSGWMKTEKACNVLGVTPHTLAKYREQFKIRTSQVGRCVLYSISDINELLKKKSK